MEPLSANSGLNPALRPVVALQGDLSVALQEGRVLSGEVLQTLGGDSILLAIGSDRVAAETQVKLEPGQRYLFRAARKDGQQLLQLLPDLGARTQNALFDALRALVSEERPVGSLLTELAQALRTEMGVDSVRVATDLLRAALTRASEASRAPAIERGTGSLERAVAQAARTIVGDGSTVAVTPDTARPPATQGAPEALGLDLLRALRAGVGGDATLTRALAPLTGEEAFLAKIAGALRSALPAPVPFDATSSPPTLEPRPAAEPTTGARPAPEPAPEPARESLRAREFLLARVESEAFRPQTDGVALRTLLTRDSIGYDTTLMAAAHEAGRDDRPAALRAFTDIVQVRLDSLGARAARPVLVHAVERALTQLANEFPVRTVDPLRAPVVARLSQGFERALRAQLPPEVAAPLANQDLGELLTRREGALLRVLLAAGGESAVLPEVLARGALEASTTDLRGALTAGALDLEPGPLRELIGRAVAALDLDAILNLARRELGDAPHFAFAVPDGAGWTTVDMYLPPRASDTQADSNREESFRLTLSVDFSHLGPIRADLLVRPGRLAARIVVSDPAVAQGLRLVAGDLEALLSVENRTVQLAITEAPQGEAVSAPPAHDIGLLRDHHLMDLSG